MLVCQRVRLIWETQEFAQKDARVPVLGGWVVLKAPETRQMAVLPETFRRSKVGMSPLWEIQ